MTAPTDLLQLALRSLPHGPEFRFVDRLISLAPGKTGVGEYLVRGDEYYLRGHLPANRSFPAYSWSRPARKWRAWSPKRIQPIHPCAIEAHRTAGCENFRFRQTRRNTPD